MIPAGTNCSRARIFHRLIQKTVHKKAKKAGGAESFCSALPACFFYSLVLVLLVSVYCMAVNYKSPRPLAEASFSHTVYEKNCAV